MKLIHAIIKTRGQKMHGRLLGFFLLFSSSAFAQVPTIASFSPLSGPIGTKVIITGTNFSTTPTLNTVYFGPVRGVVSAATATSVTVEVPIGASYNPIQVTVNLLTASSGVPFVVTKSVTQNLSTSSFAPHTDFPMASAPEHFSIADHDFNGIPDIALATTGTGFANFSAFRNTADCKNLSFAPEQILYSGSMQLKAGVVTGDFDGDGRIDVAISETTDKIVTVHQDLSNPGTIGFQNQQPLGANTLTVGDLKVADMDGDGKLDIVVALFSSLAPTGGVAIYRNTSTGINVLSFATPQNITLLANPKNVELADIDGDGKPDLIISDGTASVHIRRNKSVAGTLDNTSFDPEAVFATAANPNDLRAGDIDGDGKLDLAVACASGISLLRNTATAGTITAASFAVHADITGTTPTSLDLGDLNGDGKIDIAVNNGSNVSVFQSQATAGSLSSASLAPKLDFSIGTASVNQVRLNDMNGDGYLDVVASQTGNFFSVFLFNPPAAPAPTITSFIPASGVFNTTVTINGSNFGTSVAANRVFFGPVQGTIISASATQLTVSVPVYAAYGPIIVENLTDNLSATSQKSFTPLFNNNKDFGGRIIPASFAPKTDLTMGIGNATSVNLGDIDGDGVTDLIVANGSSDSLIIFRNKGNKILGASGFDRTDLYFDTDGNGTVLASDLDGDGKLDLAMMVRGAGDQDEILIYHNESTPGSLSPASFGPLFQVHLPFLHINNTEMVIADIDGDGKQDLVCENSGAISIFKNNSLPGSFCFAPSVDLAGAGGQAISVADIDGDGRPDLAVARGYYGLPGFNLIRNTSTPGLVSFAAPVVFAATAGNLVDVELADLDGDGKPDISWAGQNASGMALHVMRNTATSGTINASSLAAEVDYFWNTGSETPYSHTRVADLNGDGKADVVTASSSLGVFENSSTAGVIDASSFQMGVVYNPGHDYSGSYSVDYPVIGDLDGDGKAEIISVEASYAGNVIAIYHNETFPAPRIDLLKTSAGTTQSAVVGASLTLQGDLMNTYNDTPLVRFGAVQAVVTSVSNTAVNVTVPPGASYANVSVTLHGLTGFSPLPFTPTFVTNGTLDATTFATHVDFSLVTGATSALQVADFDKDGKPDLLVGDGGQLTVRQSTLAMAGDDVSTGLFGAASSGFANGIGNDPVVVSDIDGDGLTDLSVNTYLIKNTSGTTAQPISFDPYVNGLIGFNPTGSVPKANVDFNHDGKNDQVATATNGVFVSENHSTKVPFYGYTPYSTFAPGILFSVSGTLGAASAGDFDGDGYADIVFLNETANQLASMLNTGHNTQITTAFFGPQQNTATDASPLYSFVSDLDGDGKLDVAVAYSTVAMISVFQNTSSVGHISFSKIDFTTLGNALGLTVADLDGDGKPEIVTIHGGATPAFSILKNTSGGSVSFAAKLDYPLPSAPVGLATGDVNLDGKTDIIISRGTAVSVYQNQLMSAPIIVVGTQPADESTCAGTPASFSVMASGTTNLKYQWQFSATQTGTYADLADGNGYAGTKTTTLTVTPTSDNFGGFYRARIDGDLAAEVTSATAHLTISTDCSGAAPVIQSATLAAIPGGSATLDLVPLITTSGTVDISSIKVITQPPSGGVATITNGVLRVDYKGLSFVGTESVVVEACDNMGKCSQQTFTIVVSDDIIVYNAISPNGDGQNDFFKLLNIELLPTTKSNKVTIYNRWGDVVYSATNYDNAATVFVGKSNSGVTLPSGDYFYTIEMPDAKRILRGFLSLRN